MRSLAALCCVLISTGCGSTPETRDVPVFPVLPQTTCADEPNAPPADASDKAVVAYFEAVRLAGVDCRTRLNAVHDAAAAWPLPEK